jgi:transposase
VRDIKVSEDHGRATGQRLSKLAIGEILAILDGLAAGESLTTTAAAVGISEEDVRTRLSVAAEMIRENLDSPVRKRWPPRASILDWREMTVAEALEILADEAAAEDEHLPKPESED